MNASESTELTPSTPLVWLMALACGLSVGGLYYAQPLLDLLSRTLGVSSTAAASIVTVTQLGYAAGLVLLVPLGDFFNRRRLVPLLCLGSTLSLAAAAFAPGFGDFILASFLIGVTATAAQILVPMAAHLAAPNARGAVTGRAPSAASPQPSESDMTSICCDPSRMQKAPCPSRKPPGNDRASATASPLRRASGASTASAIRGTVRSSRPARLVAAAAQKASHSPWVIGHGNAKSIGWLLAEGG